MNLPSTLSALGFSGFLALAASFVVADILPEPVIGAHLPLTISSLPPSEATAGEVTAEQAKQAVISAAKGIAQAEKLNYLWRDTENLLTEAKKAGQRGDFANTVDLAQRAQHEAELAINQAHLAKARYLISKLADNPLSDDERQNLSLARRAFNAHRGREALELAEAVAGAKAQ
jgi:hypothetical protein